MSYADQEIKTNSKFLKIEQGAPMVIRLLDETPVEVFKHQIKPGVDGKFQVLCEGPETCSMCQDGHEPSQKFVVNVYNHTLHKVQLFEYGAMVGKAFKKIAVNLAEEGQDILSYDLKIEAEGASLNKKYSVTPRTTSLPVPPGLAKIKINDLPF